MGLGSFLLFHLGRRIYLLEQVAAWFKKVSAEGGGDPVISIKFLSSCASNGSSLEKGNVGLGL